MNSFVVIMFDSISYVYYKSVFTLFAFIIAWVFSILPLLCAWFSEFKAYVISALIQVKSRLGTLPPGCRQCQQPASKSVLSTGETNSLAVLTGLPADCFMEWEALEKKLESSMYCSALVFVSFEHFHTFLNSLLDLVEICIWGSFFDCVILIFLFSAYYAVYWVVLLHNLFWLNALF